MHFVLDSKYRRVSHGKCQIKALLLVLEFPPDEIFDALGLRPRVLLSGKGREPVELTPFHECYSEIRIDSIITFIFTCLGLRGMSE